jgi:hypothetical protein
MANGILVLTFSTARKSTADTFLIVSSDSRSLHF